MADDQGFRFPIDYGICSSGVTGKVFHGIILRAYPRRQRDFDLLLLGPKKETIARARVPNPNRGPFAEWTPEPQPIMRTNGPIVVTLESLREEISSADVRRIRPEWRVESSDPDWQMAVPVGLHFEDATGNEGRFLSPKERAWKLRVSFVPPSEDNRAALESKGKRALEFEFIIDPAEIEQDLRGRRGD